MTSPTKTHHPQPMPVEETQAASRWAVRLIVYVMLVLSAIAAFLLDDVLWSAARAGKLPLWTPLLPVGTFTAFVVVYIADRWLLVRRRHYPAVRAFFQVGVAAAFVALLWQPQALQLSRAPTASVTTSATSRLLAHGDPDVRAAACELAAYRGEARYLGDIEALARGDISPNVRQTCETAAARLREKVPAVAP